MLVPRTEAELTAACLAIQNAGEVCDCNVLNVKDSAAVNAMFEVHEPFQIVVNNAGLNRPKLLVDIQDEAIEAVRSQVCAFQRK
jgi:NADP-dependent 3-hydroxy acid dehydrogenase YdfG